MSGSFIQSFRLKNFKAVRDSGVVKFTPLTVFIGNNGSGKSSLVEGLQTYQDVVVAGLDNAMNRWRGFEYIHNPPIQFTSGTTNVREKISPVEFTLVGLAKQDASYRATMELAMSKNGDSVFIQEENLSIRNKKLLERDRAGQVTLSDQNFILQPDESILSLLSPSVLYYSGGKYPEVSSLTSELLHWQFMTLNPHAMGEPKPQKRASGNVRLDDDGSNIAEYLLDIRKKDQDIFDGILETLQYVLPYVRDLQPTLTSELERAVYLQLTEGKSKIPGWLLSTGTLRILAILAVLRHPEPPPLIVIEEIENGLDPRTLNLVVQEIKSVVEDGITQVIVTTHSPYFLDLLDLSDIVLVERIDDQPVFSRPADQKSLEEWAKDFGPGRLYTMSRLTSKGQS